MEDLNKRMSFSFAPKKTKPKNNVPKEVKISNRIIGVVHVSLSGMYLVKHEVVMYPITKRSFNTEKKTELYERKLILGMSRTRHIRSPNSRCKANIDYYLPFAVGCTVQGYLVKNAANIKLFHISSVSIDNDNPDAKNAIKYFRDNYDEIIDNMGLNDLEDE